LLDKVLLLAFVELLDEVLLFELLDEVLLLAFVELLDEVLLLAAFWAG